MFSNDRIKDKITKWYQLWKIIFVLTGNGKEIKNGFAKIDWTLICMSVCS